MAAPRENVATLVFLDFEATGLLSEGRKSRITELSLMSVQREELLDKFKFPRVINKLTLCLNPCQMIEPKASEITGLYNDMLESQSDFNAGVIKLLDSFLSALPRPICLLAHNGNRFDFPLLNAELKRKNAVLSDGILCADSLVGLKELDGNVNIFHGNGDNRPLVPSVCNETTPIGQSMPSVPEQVVDVKGRVRQIKRKCDPDFDRAPIEAKSVRKRLFDSAGKTDNSDSDIKLNLFGRKQTGSSSKMPADVISKRNTCDIESVKKKLSFDADDDDDDNSLDNSIDVEMSDEKEAEPHKSEVHTTGDKFNSDKERLGQLSECSHSVTLNNNLELNSQVSVKDEDLLCAVVNIESTLPNVPNLSKMQDKNVDRVQGSLSASGDTVRCETDIGMSPKCDRLSSGTTECVTPKSDRTGVSQVSGMYTPDTPGSNPTGAIINENCLTPMTGLMRSTAACQLSTPAKKDKPINLQQNGEVSSACRVLFRGDNGKVSHASDPYVNRASTAQCSATNSASNGNQYYTPVATSGPSGNGDNLKTTTYQQTPTSHHNPKVSYRLSEVYKRIFGREPADTHNSETDCSTLLKIVTKKCPEFLQWVDEHAVPLSSIDPAY